jgi:hypothetical protein
VLHCWVSELESLPRLIFFIVDSDGMKGVVDGLCTEEYELGNELVLIGCWCSSEKQRGLTVLDDWLDI